MHQLSDYYYDLPEQLIAQTAARPKSYSRLLVKGQDIRITRFYRIIDYLREGDVMVVNNTRVARNKIHARKDTGSPVEIIVMAREDRLYRCRIKGKRIREGTRLLFDDDLTAEVIRKKEDLFWIRTNKELNLEERGILPTPPYIKRKVGNDEYQTVYSRLEGSLAAPTAGLHFTDNLLRRIRKKGVKIIQICLHVGFGTFLSVKSQDIRKHKMERESYIIPENSAREINERKGRLFIVGTTTMRALESATSRKGIVKTGRGVTDMFIYPGHSFRLRPQGFITNFHLPKSTLMMLVSALVGRDELMKTYKEAIEKKMRFYSLGDACLFLENSQPQ